MFSENTTYSTSNIVVMIKIGHISEREGCSYVTFTSLRVNYLDTLSFAILYNLSDFWLSRYDEIHMCGNKWVKIMCNSF